MSAAPEKANSVASRGEAFIPPTARMRTGEGVTSESTGLFSEGGRLFSLAGGDAVPHTGVAEATTPDGSVVASNRVSTIREETSGVQTGFEQELVAVRPNDEGGATYATIVERRNGEAKFVGELDELATHEMYGFAGEIGVDPAVSPEDVIRTVYERMNNFIGAGQEEGVLLAPIEVIGQRFEGDRLNPHPYIQYIVDGMEEATGFRGLFTVFAPQTHQEYKELETGLQAATCMQSVSPLLTAMSLAGPFYQGKMEQSSMSKFTEQQQGHMQYVGLGPEDFTGISKSWRYPLRRAASPLAGAWLERPPQTAEGYFDAVDLALKEGLSTPDRLMGPHADRVRVSLGTFENCSWGQVGNLDKMAAIQIVGGAIFSNLERAIREGESPAEEWPQLFGHFEEAHRDQLNVHRHGMDALVRGRSVYEYGDDLAAFATMYDNDVPERVLQSFKASYAGAQEVENTLVSWCKKSGNAPSMRAYHETGVGIPADYMIQMYGYYSEQGMAPEVIIAKIELDVAVSFNNHVLNYRRA